MIKYPIRDCFEIICEAGDWYEYLYQPSAISHHQRKIMQMHRSDIPCICAHLQSKLKGSHNYSTIMVRLTLVFLMIVWVSGTNGWSPIRRHDIIDTAKRALLACGISCLIPLSSCADQIPGYPCPQTFSSQPLGIQNVVPNPSRPPVVRTTSPKAVCPTTMTAADANVLDYSIRGVMYLPSSVIASKDHPLPSDGSLVITVASVDKPTLVLAGAQIPLSQIASFPISFSLFKSNLLVSPPPATDHLEVEWDNRVLYAPYDLVVTAKVLNTVGTSNLQGRGYSKLLNLPYGEDDFRVVRVAASIRLAPPTSTDVLFGM